MKKLLSLLFCVALALSANAQKTYAIITGVSNYEGNDHDLAQSSKDAKSIAALYKEKNIVYVEVCNARQYHSPDTQGG